MLTILGGAMVDVGYFMHGFVDCHYRFSLCFCLRLLASLMIELGLLLAGVRIVYPF